MTSDANGPAPRPLVKLLAGIVALVAIWRYVELFRDTFIDDAFISMKYSRMIVEHGTWGFLLDRTSNTATSPLNVIVTALAGQFSTTVVDAAVYATTVELALMLWLLVRISRRLFGHAYFGALAFVALATNTLLVSTFGLEGSLFTVLVVWTIDLFLHQRWLSLAAVLGLVALARPDGALLFVIYFLMLPLAWRQRVRFTLTYALVLAPWFLFSWIHLGSFVPDTLQIKMGQRGWGRGVSFLTGLKFYVERYPLEMLSAFTLLPFAVLAWRASRREVRTVATIVSAYGVLHLIAYWVMGIPPYHWYYVNQVAPAALAGALGVTVLADAKWRSGVMSWRAALGAAAMLPAIGLAIFCARVGLPLREAPIHTNWATHAEYRDIGHWIGEHVSDRDVVFNVSEMGTVSYYSQRTIVNEFSDPNITYQAIVDRYPTLPLPARLAIDVNYYWRHLQPPLPRKSYTLIHLPVPDDRAADFGPRVVMSWDTSTRWVQHGRLYLLREGIQDGRP